ncbi:unnamed protein product [Lupinus luteus]|uniref:Sugar transporter n=1 Tax=Lupinus luteus TaxID=3873 RepID=A0AAV1WQD3_LUPLU
MKDEDGIPTTKTVTIKKEKNSDWGMFGKTRYKIWALAAILILALWSMLTGTISLRWSGNLNSLTNDIDTPIHDDLDVLEMEEREKVVRHMWDVYSNSRRIRLPRFWQEAFEAAYEELTSDVSGVRDAAINEIAKMSVRSLHFDPPPIQSGIKSLLDLLIGSATLYLWGAVIVFKVQENLPTRSWSSSVSLHWIPEVETSILASDNCWEG